MIGVGGPFPAHWGTPPPLVGDPRFEGLPPAGQVAARSQWITANEAKDGALTSAPRADMRDRCTELEERWRELERKPVPVNWALAGLLPERRMTTPLAMLDRPVPTSAPLSGLEALARLKPRYDPAALATAEQEMAGEREAYAMLQQTGMVLPKGVTLDDARLIGRYSGRHKFGRQHHG